MIYDKEQKELRSERNIRALLQGFVRNTKKHGLCPPGRGAIKFFKRRGMIIFLKKRITLVEKWGKCWIWVFRKEIELGGRNL